jgi:hypothetical protein
MSFGGGGGGGAGLIAHTHNSSLPDDGGNLDIPLTNLESMPLATYIIAVGGD